jgi:hypothetical protein
MNAIINLTTKLLCEVFALSICTLHTNTLCHLMAMSIYYIGVIHLISRGK